MAIRLIAYNAYKVVSSSLNIEEFKTMHFLFNFFLTKTTNTTETKRKRQILPSPISFLILSGFN